MDIKCTLSNQFRDLRAGLSLPAIYLYIHESLVTCSVSKVTKDANDFLGEDCQREIFRSISMDIR